MKPFLFHPYALTEADEAARFYDEQQKGLGKRFVEAYHRNNSSNAS